MPRTALKTDDIKIEQKPDITTRDELKDRSDTIVAAPVGAADKSYQAQIAFNEEPVTIRIEPSTDKNATLMHPIWCNGKGAEVLLNGKWCEVTYIPVDVEVTLKRKYVAILASAKTDTVNTVKGSVTDENPQNRITRITTAVATFSVTEDKNPRGHAWLTELRRRNS